MGRWVPLCFGSDPCLAVAVGLAAEEDDVVGGVVAHCLKGVGCVGGFEGRGRGKSAFIGEE